MTDDFDLTMTWTSGTGSNAFIRDGRHGIPAPTSCRSDRGDDAERGATWNRLDPTAPGRQETWEDSPEGYPQHPRPDAVPLA